MENDLENKSRYHTEDNSDVDGASVSAARKHYSNGNYKEALNLFLNIANKSMDSDIYCDIGSCYYRLNSSKEALEYWNKAISLNPKNPRAYTNIGNLYYKNNQIEMGISFWLVALILKPEDSQTSLNLAIAFEKKEMRFESIKYFEKYLKYEQNTSSEEYLQIKERMQTCFAAASHFLKMGVEFQSQNDNEKAANCYFKSLANYPNLSKTNLNLGSIFFSDKNLELAIKYWTASMHIDPNYDKIYSNLAISYDLKQEFDYAYCYYYIYMNYIISNKEEYYKANRRLMKLKIYLKDHPELIERHLDLAKEYLANSQVYDAIDEFKIYSILKPEEQKNYKGIIQKLESYINPEIELIKNCFETGNRLINEGKFSEAKHIFYRIMTLSSPQYLEFSKAKAKYSQCEKAEVGYND